ncbi:erythromycin esterase family protein [Glycomyces sp. A-F 0318]|uniref:erythromycin esterase family protein n=1 Tax=Glycomyces amatae TaxID=2881355 RepID=UPI001E2D3D03|nr:erythromycin esterase family protein [Glycomyces amatae]MCD0446479.1 erythromycin esterase family protein [Glycomyces amatae]
MNNPTPLRDWIAEYAATADTLDPDAPLDDLEPLRDMIGNARVVGIGESAHHMREFYRLRHRLLRFLVERCGFNVYAFEAAVLESRTVDAWTAGGPGTVEEAAAATTGTGLARCQDMHRTLTWLREYNRGAARPVRFAGILPGDDRTSPLGELSEVASYLERHDPEALPLARSAIKAASHYPDPSIVKTLTAYEEMGDAARDALTAALSRLQLRFESMSAHQRAQGNQRSHAEAMAHLRRAWHIDHFTRDMTGHGLPVGPTNLDNAMAETVIGLLQANGPDTRVVLGLHNVHLRRTATAADAAAGRFPAGYHLAQALGDEYAAIAATSGDGSAVRSELDPEEPEGFAFSIRPLQIPPDDSVETAFTGPAPLTIANLREARTATGDAGSFTKLRMEDYFADSPVLDDYDMVAYLPTAEPTEYPFAEA